MCRLLVASLAWLAVVAVAGAAAPPPGVPVMGNVPRVTPTDFKLVSTSNASSLYEIVAPTLNTTAPGHAAAYDEAPLLLRLKGSRFQAGYDYSALMHAQADETLRTFANSLFNATEQALFFRFIDFLWEKLMLPNTPAEHLEELRGMRAWHAEHPGGVQYTADVVTTRFLTLASLPADGQNIIAALEQDLEPKDWPQWLRDLVNLIIALLEKIIHGCDAYAVWGSRTQGGLFSSRNLDFNSDTGINRFKTVVVFDLDDATGGPYAQIGFGSGLGVLAGFNAKGVTTSEMNLDNHHVSLAAPAFPTRLRMVLERSVDLDSAMTVWNSTSNVNSFNFLLASSASNAAYALETKMGYTAVFPANSPIERDSTVVCTGETCSKWTNATGIVKIGKPLPEAVWRSNHGLNPTIIETQEPLFNNTVFRYDLMHDIFVGYEAANQLIDDEAATAIVATLGIKGENYLTCDQPLKGDNVLSVAYAPGPRGSAAPAGRTAGFAYVAWESGGIGSNATSPWRPAACSPYILLDLDRWM